MLRLTARELRQGYLHGSFSPVEVVRASLARIQAIRGFNAFITVTGVDALERARAAEARYRRGGGDAFALLGIPVAVKDNYDTAGTRTTYGSSLFSNHVPDESAECVRRLESAGAIVIGKTNLHEFAWGITGENPHFGACLNPWNPARVAGGSSSGSAAAVALEASPLALGSDTAGSIRIPAGFCGVLGLKPTYDRLPRGGLFPLAPSFDHVGLLARDPHDLVLLLTALEDHPRLATSGTFGEGVLAEGGAGFAGARVGVLPACTLRDLDEDVAAAVFAAASRAEGLGAQLVEIDPELFAHVFSIFVPVQQAEAFHAHHARGLFPAREREYGDDVRERLAQGSAVSLHDYLAAVSRREALAAEVRRLFTSVDVLLTPVNADPAPLLHALNDRGRAAALRKRTLRLTVPQAVLGIPACAVPAGYDRNGVPVGVQFSAPHGGDEPLLQLVAHFLGQEAFRPRDLTAM